LGKCLVFFFFFFFFLPFIRDLHTIPPLPTLARVEILVLKAAAHVKVQKKKFSPVPEISKSARRAWPEAAPSRARKMNGKKILKKKKYSFFTLGLTAVPTLTPARCCNTLVTGCKVCKKILMEEYRCFIHTRINK
jgi:hypothetical protein